MQDKQNIIKSWQWKLMLRGSFGWESAPMGFDVCLSVVLMILKFFLVYDESI